ncbi:MAG: 4-aminobutyrate--2-oxoglutarate transaminase [Armatimonadetes bacterium]|nr:4-aminobutyrate--2-oxoglutarate transaminase [Armatimonadota bacterium]
MNHGENLIRRREEAVPQGVGRLNVATAARAQGALVTDEDGRQLIDLTAGIGVAGTGHCHPRVVEAIKRQAEQLLHACIHVATYRPYVQLCEKLVQLFPHGGPTRAMLVNSGAEAVENAVKIARQYTGRPAVIGYSDGFHGRTLLAGTLTSKVGYKLGCGPYAPEVYRLPFPNRFRRQQGLDEETFVEKELHRLREAFVNLVPASQVAAVIIEPVQGEGGFNPAPFGYLQGLRRICDEHGIVLIADEVQSGFCRTGRWAAYEHSGITPDLSTWAKAMASGLPLSAVVGRTEVMQGAQAGTLGGTYGGNPVACAAALATIEVMEELNLKDRAQAIGELLRRRLTALRSRCPLIADVRGLGAMMALELQEGGAPARELTARVLGLCIERGVLVIAAGTYGNVIRFLPPLVITDEQLEQGLDVVEGALLELASHAVA